jgi:hypothetical protein
MWMIKDDSTFNIESDENGNNLIKLRFTQVLAKPINLSQFDVSEALNPLTCSYFNWSYHFSYYDIYCLMMQITSKYDLSQFGHSRCLKNSHTGGLFPLAPMGVLAPGSAHAIPSAPGSAHAIPSAL